MTRAEDPDARIRRLGALIWLAMALALCTQIGGLIGWLLGQTEGGLVLGPLLFALGLLRARPKDPGR